MTKEALAFQMNYFVGDKLVLMLVPCFHSLKQFVGD